MKRLAPHIDSGLSDTEYLAVYRGFVNKTVEVITNVDIIWLPRVVVGYFHTYAEDGVVIRTTMDGRPCYRSIPWERMITFTIMPENAEHYEDDCRRS